MKIYSAPMEGITGYIYRNAHAKYFGGIDKYFTPFITPKQKKGWSSREKNDILPEHNQNMNIVPQILTRRPQDLIRSAERLSGMGYEEINLNLGCPSKTVVSKGKGSGLLEDLSYLEQFFDEYFRSCNVPLSIKTRLGIRDPREAGPLMELFDRFPFSEVIVHARVQEDYYKKPVNLFTFSESCLLCQHPLIYNGDINKKEDAEMIRERFPEIKGVMIGRGLLCDPQLAERIQGESTKKLVTWKKFHDDICSGYEEEMSGERNVLFKMKELWSYWITSFCCGEKYNKKIKKVKSLDEYRQVVDNLFLEEQSMEA